MMLWEFFISMNQGVILGAKSSTDGFGVMICIFLSVIGCFY